MSYARQKRLERWEYKNQIQFLRLVKTSQELSKTNMLRAARLTSFLLYLMYGAGKLGLVIARSLFQGPEMVRLVGPEHRPLERHQFEKQYDKFGRSSINALL